VRAHHLLTCSLAIATVATVSARARADEPPSAPVPPSPDGTVPAAPPALTPGGKLAQEFESAPPPSSVIYFQYGVAFSAENVLSAGPTCDNVAVPCILGTGGGIVVRGGWRGDGPFYLGAAYELTKQDPNKLYRLALLQQARAEGRYYFMTARVTEPYLLAGVGLAGYGNEWGVDTWGPVAAFGGGLEYQVTRTTVVGLALAYRLLHLNRFTDTAGSERAAGFAQLLGLDVVLEQRDAVLRTSGPRNP
jgi:hypothetical protein